MKALILLATKGGRYLLAKRSPGRADPRDLETYYSPAEEIEISCSTEERDDFEQFVEIDVDTDIPSAENFRKLVAYLSEHYRLKVI